MFCLTRLFVLAVLFSMIAGHCSFATAQDNKNSNRVIPDSNAQIQLSYASVVKKAAPAVVNIYASKVVKQRVFSPFLNDQILQHFFGETVPEGMTRKRLENSLGSGVIVRPDGMIVTSNHVISGADEITVVLADRREFAAQLMINDEKADLAVLKIDTKGEALPWLPLRDSDDVEVGDLVIAIGNPFGVGQTVTSGIISALSRTSTGINDLNYFIQTDAAINPGNSGGALVTLDGKLLGINAAIYSRDGGNLGLGFAVPSNMVRTILSSVAAGGKQLVRPWTGIDGQDVTSDIAASLSLPRPAGVLVKSLHSASPAKQAGLKTGDVIVSVNGHSVQDMASMKYRFDTLGVNGKARLEVMRKGTAQSIELNLVSPPEDPPRQKTTIKGNSPLSGAIIANLSPALASELGMRDDMQGVVVIGVADLTPAATLGFRKGDIIVSIHDINIENVADVLRAGDATSKYNSQSKAWRMRIRRGNVISELIVR